MKENLFAFFKLVIFVFLVTLSCIGFFRWLAAGNPEQSTDKKNKNKNVDILCLGAFIVLSCTATFSSGIIPKWISELDFSNKKSADVILNLSKLGVKFLFVTLLLFVILSAFFCIVLIFLDGLKKILESLKASDKLVASALSQNPLVPLIITIGVLSTFVALPLFSKTPDSDSLFERWKSGVEFIAKTVYPQIDFSSFLQPLCTYSLIYLIVVGTGYAAFKIIYAIIKKEINKDSDRKQYSPDTKDDFLNEYANPIGFLLVGIALLYAFILVPPGSDPGSKSKFLEILLNNILIPMLAVVFITAIIIFTLEIVQLLFSLKEHAIRKQARYLFVYLVGRISILILRILAMIFDTMISVISSNQAQNALSDKLLKMEETIIDLIFYDMENELQSDTHAYNTLFSSFRSTITKK